MKTSPAVDENGRVYIGIQGEDANMYCLDRNGIMCWSYHTDDYWGTASSAVFDDEGRVYFGADNRRLHVLNSDGSQYWSFDAEDDVVSSPTVDQDGKIYFGTSALGTGTFYAVHPDSGLLWSYVVGDQIDTSSARSNDGMLYFGSDDGNWYAINSAGGFQWSYFEGGYIVSSSPALDSNGLMCVGGASNNLYLFTLFGRVAWSYNTGSNIYTSPAIGEDGTIYVGTTGNVLFSLGRHTPTPTWTPTPTPTEQPTEVPPPTDQPTPPPTATPKPPAKIALNAARFLPGEAVTAVLEMSEPVTQPFTAFAALIMPNGKKFTLPKLKRGLKPVASNVPGLRAPFSFSLLNGKTIPSGVPKGRYEVVVCFFNPAGPFRRSAAFREASASFVVE
jgi:hypothetical protein